MRHIDKKLHKRQGEQIVSEFLARFYQRYNCYPDDMYAAFSKEYDDSHNHAIFRKRLIDEVLIPEQDGLCCYCLRRLSGCIKPNVEHIMPNHAADKNELDLYRKRPTELNGLPHSDDFKSTASGFNPPHPHSIAYQNLVVSCDGLLFEESKKPVCCNLKRRHSFVPPFILYPDIQETFQYWPDGTAEWIQDPEPPESQTNAVRILKLNQFILKMVRRIWFFCTDNGLNPHGGNRDEIINTMFGFLDAGEANEANMLMNFKKDKYWNLLLQYDAFATIRHV